MAKSVVIHYRMEVVDLDADVYKRAGQEMLKNQGKWPPIPELPGLDLNEVRIYHPCVEAKELRLDEMFSMADHMATKAASAIMNSKKDKDVIPYRLLLKEETK